MAYNTGNPIGSADPRDLSDNAQNLDEAMNKEGSNWTDRLGRTRKTFQAAENAVVQAEQAADNAIDTLIPAEVDRAEQAADNAITTLIPAEVDRAANYVETILEPDSADALNVSVAKSALRAEAARDVAFINADVYDDVAAGLAAVADGEQFQVVEGDEIVRYKRVNASTVSEVARFPTTGRIDKRAYLKTVGRNGIALGGIAWANQTRVIENEVLHDGRIDSIELETRGGYFILLRFRKESGAYVARGVPIPIHIERSESPFIAKITEADFGLIPVQSGDFIGVHPVSSGSIYQVNGDTGDGWAFATGYSLDFTSSVYTSAAIQVKISIVYGREERVSRLESFLGDHSESPALMDHFSVDSLTPIGSNAGNYQSGDYQPSEKSRYVGEYYRIGDFDYSVCDNGVVRRESAPGLPSPFVGRSGVMLPISQLWLKTTGCLEVRAGFTSRFFGSTSSILYLDLGNGNTVFVNIVQGTDDFDVAIAHNGSTVNIATDITEGGPDVAAGSYEVLLRISLPNLLSLEIHGLPYPKDGQSPDGIFRASALIPGGDLDNIKAVGFGLDSSVSRQTGWSCNYFDVRPSQKIGSTVYRPLQPMPAPVVPQITKAGVIWNGENTPYTSSKQLNFSVVDMSAIAGDLGITPVDNYYAYYSTDHSDGGIWMLTSPAPEGPWTPYVGSGAGERIYDDDIGESTETPVVRFDPENNRLLMMYHVIAYGILPGGGQRSIMAESADGITWTRIGVASAAGINDRNYYYHHDGYSTFWLDPLGVVPGWSAFFRQTGGQAASRWGVAHSPDGVKYLPDPVPLKMPALQRVAHDPYVIDCPGYGTSPFEYLGQRLLPISPFRAGAFQGGSDAKGYLAIVALGDDGRNMSADEFFIEPTLPTEAGVPIVSSVLVKDQKAYIYVLWERQYLHLYIADLDAPPQGQSRPF